MPIVKDIIKAHKKKAYAMPASDFFDPDLDQVSELSQYVPKEVLDVSYGFGAPAGFAELNSGEAVLDIGCGGGVSCFQAARIVGPEGRVVGIDRADDMLSIARRNAPVVMRNLEYGSPVVEFRKGETEDLPVESSSFDLVISSSIINLSPDLETAFEEMYRVLRPGGRIIISAVVSDQPVPRYLQEDEEKWGVCLSGSVQIGEYLRIIRKAGFLGVEQVEFSPWCRVDGIHFYSVTVRGQKLRPLAVGTSPFRYAILRGPFSKVKDERGNVFQRGQSKKISKETAELLNLSAYQPYFLLTNEASDLESIEKSLIYVPPEHGKLLWEGWFATLTGLFLMAEDDDHHMFYAGAPLEICDRTQRTLAHESYRMFFSILNRAELSQDGQKAGGSEAAQSR